MRNGFFWSLGAGVLLGVLLFLATRDVWLVPVGLLAAGVPGAVIGWLASRRDLQGEFARPVSVACRPEPAPLEGPAAEFHDEFQRLEYQPCGFVVLDDEWHGPAAVYIHKSLPIYAFMRLDSGQGADGPPLRMESFFEGGGRLTTVSYPPPPRLEASTRVGGSAGAPRLVQRRAWGPPTPTALDGQHVGTLRAWMAGKRQPLPATMEALPGYLERDHQELRGILKRTGWISLPDYLRAACGAPRRVLKF